MGTPDTKNIFTKHIESYKTSKLSRAKYCKLNGLVYHQFNYWIKKGVKPAPMLLPVQVKNTVQNSTDYREQPQKVLCTLDFGRNGCLKIYDSEAMKSILERLL